MTDVHEVPRSALLTSFFERLPTLEGVVRAILSDARLSAELTFRGQPKRKVLLDLDQFPARVLVDDDTRTGTIRVAIDADLMHEILLGRLSPGVAFGRRQLLLRGSAGDLARFTPLFDFAPMLYREHLADLGVDGFTRPTGRAPLREMFMNGKEFKGDPIPLRKLSRAEEVCFGVLKAVAYAAGYAVGILRHRLFRNLSLFDMLASLSRGMAAATPPDKRG